MALVEPPSACRTVMAFSKEWRVRMDCGRRGPGTGLLGGEEEGEGTAMRVMRRPTCSATRKRAEEGAVGVAEPRGAMPSASRRQAIVDAVPVHSASEVSVR